MGELNEVTKRVCVNCGSDNTFIHKDGRKQWYYHNGLLYCNRCNGKLFSGPKYNPINSKKFNPRHMMFKTKQVYLKEKSRKDVCEWCKKKIGDFYTNYKGKLARVKRTSMHHIEYHDSDPLENTVELCNPCHGKETWRLRRQRQIH